MHKIAIPQKIVDRVRRQRGTLHVHDNVNPRTTALIVVDLQNCFMVEEVAAAFVPEAVEIVPNVNRLAAAVRETGGRVFWIRNTVNDYDLDSWSEWFAMMKGNPHEIRRRADNMRIGARGHALYPDLVVKPDDQTVFKQRFSAFLAGSSGLPEMLRIQGIDTVIITGTATNVCCESSARDAMMMNFKVIMVSDANATFTDEEHNATLMSMYAIFGDVMDTDYLIDRLRRNAAPAEAAE